MLIQEVEKTFSNVGADLLAVRVGWGVGWGGWGGVEPDDLSVSVILFPFAQFRALYCSFLF